VAEVAVVGVADALKGQVPLAFAVVKDGARLAAPDARAAMEREVIGVVDEQIGAFARPARIHFIAQLPKTRSGKVLRRSIQAIAEGRDPGDLTTLDDPAGIEQIQRAVADERPDSAARPDPRNAPRGGRHATSEGDARARAADPDIHRRHTPGPAR
jgi:propionyl-CoA synthetase